MRWRLTPVEPSAEMCAACDGMNEDKHLARGRAFDAYTSMLAASPSPTKDGELLEEVAARIWSGTFKHSTLLEWSELRSGQHHHTLTLLAAKSILSLLSGEGK